MRAIMHHGERGAALVIGLVLLMVLTVLAISVMRTATLDLAMSGNTQVRENAFQLAESGVDAALRDAEGGLLDLAVVPDCPTTTRPWADADLPWAAAVEIPALRGRYETRICREGATVDMPGSSIGRFRQVHYRLEARGRTDQRNAEALHARGFYLQVNDE
jgi:hypothetical protein